MFSLLLVDDEPVLIDSFIALEWEQVGVTQIHRASNGIEALELLELYPIDIVVTDIRMPGIDGLELCRQIDERYKNTKCIIMSGYAEFEYARKAIQYGTKSYLLKPVRDKELLNLVQNLIEQIRTEWVNVSSHENALNTLRLNLPLLRANLLNDLLISKSGDYSGLLDQSKLYSIEFKENDLTSIVAIRLEEWFRESREQERSLYEFALLNIAAEIFKDDFQMWGCTNPLGYLVLLIKPVEKPVDTRSKIKAAKLLEKSATQLQKSIDLYLKGKASLVLSQWGLFPNDLETLYKSVLHEFRNLPKSEHEFFIRLTGQEQLRSKESLLSLYAPPTMIQLFEAGRCEDVLVKCDEIFHELKSKKLDTEDHLKEVMWAFRHAFSYFSHLQGYSLLEIDPTSYNLSDFTVVTAEELLQWAKTIVRKMDALRNQENDNAQGKLVSKIHRFIEENVSSDVSLQTIASYVNFHPVYLSYLYKTKTGNNISDHIHQFRMEKALHLLRTTDLKVYELSRKLGFQNPAYFTKLFKNHYDITPQECRESHNHS